MSNTAKLSPGALVVVASGEIAKFFTLKANGRLEFIRELTPQNLDDEGPAGKRPTESSEQSTDEATFAKQLAHALYDRVYNSDITSVAVIADPRTLGEMRPSLHHEVAKRLALEIDKTMIHAEVSAIEKLLEDARS